MSSKPTGIFKLITRYKTSIGFNIFFNLLAALFSLFTFASIVPFLEILFKTEKKVLKVPGPFEFNSDYIINALSYKLDAFIKFNGESYALAFFCGVIVVMSLFKNITTYLSNFFLANVRMGVVRDIRENMYTKLISLPLSYFSEEKKGDVISKMTNDVVEVEWSIIGSLQMLFKSPIMFIIYLGSLFFMSWELTLISLLILPSAGFLIARLAKSLKLSASKGQAQLGGILSLVEESLSGIRIIKAFNAQNTMTNRFKAQNNSLFELMVGVFRRHYMASPLSEFFGTGIMVILLWIGGNMVLDVETALDGKFFILYLILFSQIISPVKAFSDAWFKISKGQASLDRMGTILNAKNNLVDLPGSKEIDGIKEEVKFDKVSFAYGKEKVLNEVSFTIKKGETVALVGPSGGGKSTIADLLSRFYNASGGQITVDNTPLTDIKIKSWRSMLGIVSQHSILFNDTITNNIALGSENPNLERVKQAAHVANAGDFIEDSSNGYDTNIGDGGNKLSGGQKQRVSIARAIYANPDLLILDEATSALDTESEQLVQKAIENLTQDRTTLVIAHRLSTIQNANRIIVIDKGRIRESGTHDELISQNGLYAKLVQMQQFE